VIFDLSNKESRNKKQRRVWRSWNWRVRARPPTYIVRSRRRRY